VLRHLRGPKRWAAVAIAVCLPNLTLIAPTASAVFASTPTPLAYELAVSNGSSFTFNGQGVTVGSAMHLDRPVVGMASTPDGNGYWLVGADGGVFNFGSAQFYGSTGAQRLAKPVVGMAATPAGDGYWLVAADGGVFNFGKAHFYGSTGGVRLNQPVVGIVPTPSGNGYWLVAADGGVFRFGDAHFYGSTGAVHLNQPVVGMATSQDGFGYWLVAADGGIFNFGDAHFHGSTGGVHLTKPVVGMTPTPDGGGYWLAAADGGVFNLGNARFYGSASGSVSASARVVAVSRPLNGPLPSTSGSSSAEFDSPAGVAFAGGHLWVVNKSGNSVTEINPTNPATWTATFSGSAYSFSSPDAIASNGNGTDLFVANAGGSVTELSAANGALVRVISGSQYGFSSPVAVTVDGSTLLVLNSNSVTEIDASTGALIRVISGAGYSFVGPKAMTVAGSDLFVANANNNSVTDLLIATGALVRVITSGGLSGPDGIASGSGYVWVSNSSDNTATRVTASNDSAQNFSSGSYGFGSPSAIAESNGYIYVLSPYGSSPMVTKIDEATGSAPWYMCNTNGPYYFSNLSAITIANGEVWAVSEDGQNYPDPAAARGSLTEFSANDGSLVQTVP
jgi:hypothetical protein